MVSRPNWKGHLKLSLVSCAVAMYTATTEREKVAFHLLNRKTGNRLKRQMVDAETGDAVDSDGQTKGYEVSKGDYIVFDTDELDTVALESTHTIDIDGFVPRSDITDVFLDTPYYLVPNDKIGEEAFAVIREAMNKRGMAGLARVVLYRRERVVMLEPHQKGIIVTTLRYPYEIKDEGEFFEPIASKAIPAEMLQLAEHIIETKRQRFDPSRFKDRYEDAIKDLIAAKSKGRMPRVAAPDHAPTNVVDLMEALRRSVAGPAKTTADASKSDAKVGGPKPEARRSARKPAAIGGKGKAADKTPAPEQRKAG